MGEQICRALPLWFTVTGCDTVSMFAGRGKKPLGMFGRVIPMQQKRLWGNVIPLIYTENYDSIIKNIC